MLHSGGYKYTKLYYTRLVYGHAASCMAMQQQIISYSIVLKRTIKCKGMASDCMNPPPRSATIPLQATTTNIEFITTTALVLHAHDLMDYLHKIVSIDVSVWKVV